LTQKDITSGASSDIERATEIAYNMVKKYGMSDKIGPVVYGSSRNEVFIGRDFGTTINYSEEMACKIDEEVKLIISEEYKHAEQILTDNMAKLHKIAGFLFNNEKMTGDQFAEFMKDGTVDGTAI
ncbi:MAG: ATP-dependent zinc metalloprotease FtsH, partial [Acutalibacteraceae bacterium]